MKRVKWCCGLLIVLATLLMSPVASAATNGKIVVSDAQGKAGETVTVEVRLEDNPGIISAAVEVYYDTSSLELISVENKEMMPESAFSPDYSSYPYCANWTSAYTSKNITADGVLMTMTFKILEDADAGEATIDVRFDPANFFDYNMKTKPFTAVDGAITIRSSGSEQPADKTESNSSTNEQKKESTYHLYSDLDPDGWYRSYVEYMLEKGYMNGMGATTFSPDGNVTRAQLVTILYRIAGEPSVSGLRNPFDDVGKNTWYTNAVIWAADNGIVTGITQTTFAPDNPITREQLATILYRYHGSPKALGNHLYQFKDYTGVSAYAVDAMNWAVGRGILNGSGDQLMPAASATRVQTAAMLTRYLENEIMIPAPTDPTLQDS